MKGSRCIPYIGRDEKICLKGHDDAVLSLGFSKSTIYKQGFEYGKRAAEGNIYIAVVLQTLQRGNYDCAKILSAFADIEDAKRLRQEVDHDRQNLEARLKECRETLPLADQFHSSK